MLDEQVAAQIRFELTQLERLLASYQDLLARFAQTSAGEPTLIETTALASVLHSFYTGVENIFQLVAKRVDRQLLSGERWHRDLLDQMSQATDERAALLTAETGKRLREYLAFRHFYRHSYSNFLDWQRLALLAAPLPELTQTIQTEVEAWLRNAAQRQQ